MATLTRTRAVSFLQDILGISVPCDTPDGQPRCDLPFLNRIIREFMGKLPFQSVTLIAEDLARRHVPSKSEIVEAMFKQHGGVCHSLNSFMFFLLEGLGYDVTLGHAFVFVEEDEHRDNHIIVFVQSLVTEGDLFLVDVGFGEPSFEAVSLDFETESPLYKHSYLEYKFFKQDGKIIRANGKGDIRLTRGPKPWEVCIGPWRGAYEFRTENIRRFDEFQKFYGHQYTSLDGMLFQRSLRAVMYPNGKALIILHSNMLCENESGDLVKYPLADDETVLKAYLKHFPQFEEEMVKRAVVTWRKQM
ncbi:arylamine N-acetyltransferase, pineal gland isozyme NAT-3-like [Haliotis asinina]|uniref:arylamine N-acetyltransferase, pineal gland isozyme NAT-3-like n=1 Tax=Haliotis asinina TaxID=109174 RepID=UPI0035327C42